MFEQKNIDNLLSARNMQNVNLVFHAYMLELLFSYHGWHNNVMKENGNDKYYRWLSWEANDRLEQLISDKKFSLYGVHNPIKRRAIMRANEKIDKENKRIMDIIKSHFNLETGLYRFGNYYYGY